MHNSSVPITTIRDLTIELQPDGKNPVNQWLGTSIRGRLLGALTGIEQDRSGNLEDLPLVEDGLCRRYFDFESAADTICQSCATRMNCSYGCTFAGQLMAPNNRVRHQQASFRPASFLSPMIEGVDPSGGPVEISVGIQLLGALATQYAPTILDRLMDLDSGRVGPHRAKLWTAAAYCKHETICLDQLPPDDQNDILVRRVAVITESPIFVKSKYVERLNGDQVFRFLIARCLGLIETLMGESEHANVMFPELLSLAASVCCVQRNITPYRQLNTSSRGRGPGRSRRLQRHGWTGHWIFADVPSCLIPWLRLGGQLGIGEHRSAGAGRWNSVVRYG